MMQKSVPNKGRWFYNNAVENCERAYKLGGNDNEIMIDALNLQGICLFRLGKLIESVKVLFKAKMIRNRLIEEEAARRERMKKKDVLDEIVGYYFTRRDFLAIAKKRSRSFDFKRHKKLRNPPRKLTMKRTKSWDAPEL